MATTGGARAMLENDLGLLTLGQKADLVLHDAAASWWTPLNDPVQQFMFGERGGSVRTVIVDEIHAVASTKRGAHLASEPCFMPPRSRRPARRSRQP